MRIQWGCIDMGRLSSEDPNDDAPFRYNFTCCAVPLPRRNTPSSCQPGSEPGRLAILGHVIYALSVIHEHLTARLLRLLVWMTLLRVLRIKMEEMRSGSASL
jgi:hypothetical protein